MSTDRTDLLADLAQIARGLNELGVLEVRRDDLANQIANLEKEIEKLHTKHADQVQQIRYATEAIAALQSKQQEEKAKLAEAKVELRKLFQPLARSAA